MDSNEKGSSDSQQTSNSQRSISASTKEKIRKTAATKTKNYSSEDLDEAVHRVKNKELTAYAAGKQYNIPKSTIDNHVKGKTTNKSTGRPPLFDEEQEKTILNFLIQLSEWGYPLNKAQFKQVAKEFAIKYDITLNGKEWTPGEDWMSG